MRARTLLAAAALAAPLVSAAALTAPRAPLARAEQTRLAFEPNAGRGGGDVNFVARTRAGTIYLGKFGFSVARGRDVVETTLTGSRPARPQPEGKLQGKVNWFVGDDPAAWRRGLPTYEAVRYSRVYPRTDLVFHGRGRDLEYDFQLQPGANPRRIALAISGALGMRVAPGGDLLLRTSGGILRQHRPVASQDGRRVEAAYDLRNGEVRFRLGAYDRSRPLLIDPVLEFGTYAGGTAGDVPEAMAVDSAGAAYTVGRTGSDDWPGTVNGASSTNGDAFVQKLAPGGQSTEWVTVLGGNNSDQAEDIDLKGTEAYITGYATGTFPTTAGALQTSHTGTGADAFISHLGPDGVPLYTTFLGGTLDDKGTAIDVDSDGNAYATGDTASSDFPVTATGVAQSAPGGDYDGYVAKINQTGTARDWSTYMGGTGHDRSKGIAITGNAVYVAGYTNSSAFPGTPVHAYSAAQDIWALSMPLTGASVSWSTFLGGTGDDRTHGLEITAAGEPVVLGETRSTTTYPLGGTLQGASDVFVTQLDYLTGGVGSSQAYRGNGEDIGNALAADPNSGNAVSVAGRTTSTDLQTPNGLQGQNGGGTFDAFVAKFALTSGIAFASYLGGPEVEDAAAAAVDSSGSTWVAGNTDDTAFPWVTSGKTTPSGGSEAFILKFRVHAAQIASGPSGVTNSTDGVFTFSSSDSGSTFKCRLDSSLPGDLATCTSPKSNAGLSDGTHTFQLQEYDRAASTDGSLATRTWTVDTQAPAAFGLEAPASGTTTGLQPEFRWNEASDLTSAVSYRLLVDGVDADGRSACGGGSCSQTPGTILAVGTHSWNVVAVDAAGNERDSETRIFTAAAPPSARLIVAPNPALVGRPVVFDGSGSGDAGNAITSFEWDLDGDGTFEQNTGTTPTASRSYDAPATLSPAMRVTNAVGLTAEQRMSLKVSTAPSAGPQLGVSINNGARYTRTPDVTVTSAFPAVTTQLLFSNDGGFFAGTTLAPARFTKWRLDSSGPERLPKTIYVRFLLGPIVSETFQDDIILDETAPAVQQAQVRPTPQRAASAARLRSWKLRVRATDSNSGVDKLQVTSNKRRPGRLLTYRTRLTVRAAARPRFVRARDRAGNLSKWRRAR